MLQIQLVHICLKKGTKSMGDIEEILYLIEQGVENERVDFKQDYYLKEKRADLIKDICAFANGESNEAKYIVFGVSDQNFEVCKVLKTELLIHFSLQLIHAYCILAPVP